MPEKFSSSVEVRFIDHAQVIRDLRQAVAEAKSRCPEILKVYLFGSLVQGTWTADSDADLMVVVRREFAGDHLERGGYHIRVKSIPTDTLVYTEAEFAALANDRESFLARNLTSALEL
ncbi:MAG TPA: nucleotidyltransferase domain-containing protein [Terriglobia bacterium]|nr:nucleotidyltransferase domain-containing protein [Terriglobia bacterium]